ncbi:MAG: hypothetical protein AAB445_02760 [Patescibacteria group bacterium]
MLVQKQTPARLKKILLFGGIPIVLLAGYVLYTNLTGGYDPGSVGTPTQQKTVSKDFGQALFRDSRFYALSPKGGTDLITQAAVPVPATDIPAPAVDAFDVQTGGTILLTWKIPAGINANFVRVAKVTNAGRENLATLPMPATAFLFTRATDKQAVTYQVYFVQQTGLTQSAQVAAKTNESVGGLTVTVADEAGVRLQWTAPVGSEEKAAEVYRSEAAGSLGQQVASLDAGATGYEDANGRAGLHFYTVLWVAESLQGQAWSGSIASTDSTSPKAPDFVTATYDAANALARVAWVPSTSLDVVRYDVYRSDESLTLGTSIGQKLVADVATVDDVAVDAQKDCAKDFCFEDTKLVAGKTLYYSVIAVDAAGNRSSTQELGHSGRANPFLPL